MSNFKDNFDAESVHTARLGQQLEAMGNMSVNSPVYDALVRELNDRVQAKLSDAKQRAGRARKLAIFVPLTSDQRVVVESEYPEFRVVDYVLEKPPHGLFVAQRRLANELISTDITAYADSVVHIGGEVAPHVLANRARFHVECDPDSAMQCHTRYSNAVILFKVFSDMKQFSTVVGRLHKQEHYAKHLQGDHAHSCQRGAACVHKAEGMLFDLSQRLMAPVQMVAAMTAAEAKVAYGFFIYDPVMLLSDEGYLPKHNIWFKKHYPTIGRAFIQLEYPDGVVGTTRMDLAAWTALCVSSHISIPIADSRDDHYFLELTMQRGPFMFFRLTWSAERPKAYSIRHALSLGSPDERYVIHGWRLRNVAANPDEESSWESHVFTADKSLVDKVYDFGLSLEASQFTRVALRKRMEFYNDRSIVRGTTVHTRAPLDESMVNSLTTALFSRLFVDRYEQGKLGKEMTSVLRSVSGFSRSSNLQKIALVSWLLLRSSVGKTAYKIDSIVRWLCDSITSWFTGKGTSKSISINLACSYMAYEQVVGSWGHMLTRKMDDVARFVNNPQNFLVVVNYVGAFLMRNWLSRLVTVGLSDAAHITRMSFLGFSYIIDAAHALREYKRDPVLDAVDRNAELHEAVTYGHANVTVSDYDLTETMRDAMESMFTDPAHREIYDMVSQLGYIESEPHSRHDIYASVASVVGGPTTDDGCHVEEVTGFVQIMNETYATILSEVADSCLEYDIASTALEPQDRALDAVFMSIPHDNQLPKARRVYKSRLRALNVSKRQNTKTELLSAMSVRNTADPRISIPQDNTVLIPEIWDNFLEKFCVPDAKDKLRFYRTDLVGIGTDAIKQWFGRNPPDKASAVRDEIDKDFKTLNELSIEEYQAMIKADVKPTISIKPVYERTEPQVIVYHSKFINFLFSSLFSVITRRYLSLLKPSILVGVLKDPKAMEEFVRANHDFDKRTIYLENDFSKFDKSQGRFVFMFEKYMFEQLGMNQELCDAWSEGHRFCKLSSMQTGLMLHVYYQRKSGDATTSIGNAMINTSSVAMAYQLSQVKWGAFMGDDSLVAVTEVPHGDRAVRVLAEVFNLSAKYYITSVPYYLSNFLLIDNENREVKMIPDPIKRIEKLSASLPADSPDWEERYKSAKDALNPYMYPKYKRALAEAVHQRYGVPIDYSNELFACLATCISSLENFKSIWESEPEDILY